jgi:hypothetical protein
MRAHLGSVVSLRQLLLGVAMLSTACAVDVGPGPGAPPPPPPAPPPPASAQPPTAGTPNATRPAPVAQVARRPPAPTLAPATPVQLSRRTTPAANGAALRIPEHTDLDRMVTMKNGQRVTVRQALATVDPNEKHVLKNGKEVTLQQVIDAFEALEKRSNGRLALSMKHFPMPPTTKAKLDQAHASLTQEREHRRALEAAGWKELIERKAGSARAFQPLAVRFPGRAAASVPSAPASAAPSGVGARRLPQPSAEPLDLAWSDQWGDPNVVAAGLNVGAGNEFTYSKEGDPTAECAGDVTANVVLFTHPYEVVRALAVASAATTPNRTGVQIQATGDLGVYVLGQSTPVWEKTGQFTLPKTEKAYNTPDASIPITIIGPLILNLDAEGTGSLGIQAGITPNSVTGKSVSCTANVTPYLGAQLQGGATLELEGLAKDLVDAIIGSVDAGLTANLTVIDAQVPANLGLTINLNPSTHMASSMDQTSNVSFLATLMSGNLVGYVTLNVHWWVEPLLWAFGLDDGTYQTTLANWNGEQVNIPLVGPKTNTIRFGG